MILTEHRNGIETNPSLTRNQQLGLLLPPPPFAKQTEDSKWEAGIFPHLKNALWFSILKRNWYLVTDEFSNPNFFAEIQDFGGTSECKIGDQRCVRIGWICTNQRDSTEYNRLGLFWDEFFRHFHAFTYLDWIFE